MTLRSWSWSSGAGVIRFFPFFSVGEPDPATADLGFGGHAPGAQCILNSESGYPKGRWLMLAAEDRMSTILDDLIEEEERTFLERAPEATRLDLVARRSLAGG